MRKQYTYHELTFIKYEFDVYHDGELVDRFYVWDEEIFDRIREMESSGYTFGYLPDEVEEAKNTYEHQLKNMIKGEDK